LIRRIIPSDLRVSWFTRNRISLASQDVPYSTANDPDHSRPDKAGHPGGRPIRQRFYTGRQKQKTEPPKREGACRPIQYTTNASDDHLFTPLISTKDAPAQRQKRQRDGSNSAEAGNAMSILT
jgi:hypothetical protein